MQLAPLFDAAHAMSMAISAEMSDIPIVGRDDEKVRKQSLVELLQPDSIRLSHNPIASTWLEHSIWSPT